MKVNINELLENAYIFPKFKNREDIEEILGKIFSYYNNEGNDIHIFLDKSFNALSKVKTVEILRTIKVSKEEKEELLKATVFTLKAEEEKENDKLKRKKLKETIKKQLESYSQSGEKEKFFKEMVNLMM